MRQLKVCIRHRPNTAISIPAILCAIQFVTGLMSAIKNGNFDSDTLTTLMSCADGFESVVLFILMIFLRRK